MPEAAITLRSPVRDLLEELDVHSEQYLEEYTSLMSDAVRLAPDFDPEAEWRFAERLARFHARLIAESGLSIAGLFATDHATRVENVMLESYKAEAPVLRLAHKQLADSLEVHLKVTKQLNSVADVLEQGLDEVSEHLNEPLSVAQDVPFWEAYFRMTLAIGACFEVPGELEMTHWSRRALEHSRDVELEFDSFRQELDAVKQLLRSKNAWQSWDDSDVEQERSAWEHFATKRA